VLSALWLGTLDRPRRHRQPAVLSQRDAHRRDLPRTRPGRPASRHWLGWV